MTPTPASGGRLHSSHLCWLLASLLIVAATILFLLPNNLIIEWAIKLYGRGGAVTEKGIDLITATLFRLRLTLLLTGSSAVLLTFILRRSEHLMMQANASTNHPPRQIPISYPITKSILGLILVASMIRLAIGLVHIRDSLWYDELFTVKRYGLTNLSVIFGASGQQLPNNHILNSLLVRVSLGLGWNSEPGLRIWHLITSVLTIPAAAYLARVALLSRLTTAMLLLVLACSPVIDRFGSQARGYGLAIFLATCSLAIHLACIKSASRGKFALLILTNGLLGLANVFTLPLICGEILHLVVEAYWPKSFLRCHGHVSYNSHLLVLLISGLLVIGLHTFLLPSLVLNSIVFSSKAPLSITTLLQIPSAILTQSGNALVGIMLCVVVLLGVCIWKNDLLHYQAAIAILCVVGCGVAFAILSRMFMWRALAYLHVTSVVGLFFVVDAFVRRSRNARVIGLVCSLAVSSWGAFESISRPPLQDIRGLILEAQGMADGRIIWTSGSVGKVVDFYARIPVLQTIPSEPSLYLCFCTGLTDPVPELVKRRCMVAKRLIAEEEMSIYECAACDRAGGRR